MARYSKLAPLVFCLAACLILLVGCAKAPADRVKEGQQLLQQGDHSHALEQARAAIATLKDQPAAPERDRMLFDAQVLEVKALGNIDEKQALAAYQSLEKEPLMTGEVLWDIAVALSDGTGTGQGVAVKLLHEGKSRYKDQAARFDQLIENIKKNPSGAAQDALRSLGYIGGSKKEEKVEDAAKKEGEQKAKE